MGMHNALRQVKDQPYSAAVLLQYAQLLGPTVNGLDWAFSVWILHP
jgi:hypothetical protein